MSKFCIFILEDGNPLRAAVRQAQKQFFLFSLFASELTDRQKDRHAEAVVVVVVGRNHFAPGGASSPAMSPLNSSLLLPSPLPEESTL
jgi:hypothetical protein